MATITPSTTYPNGAALDIAGHNANIFSTTSGRGVLSEPNGGLGISNLDAAFKVRDEHVMSEEMLRGTQDGLNVPMDIFSNAFGDLGVTEDSSQEKSFVTVAGLSHRVFFPYTTTFVLWQWSFFASLYRPCFWSFNDGFSTDSIIIRAYLDGQPIAAFTRPLTVSAMLYEKELSGSFYNYPLREDYEDLTAMWYDFSKLTTGVTKGYHELNIKVFMERADRTVQARAEEIIPDAADPEDLYDYKALNRVTFGVRNVRCLSFT